MRMEWITTQARDAWIRGRLAVLDISWTEIADALGIDRSAPPKVFRQRSRRVEEEIAKCLGLRWDELWYERANPHRDSVAPVERGPRADEPEAGALDIFEAALAELAAAAEYGIGQMTPSPRFRTALDAAWLVLGPEVRDAARMAAGCGKCGGPIASPEDDLCGPCADQVPSVEVSR